MSSMREELYVGDALLLADVQNDFLPGGALGVKGGDEILPILCGYMTRFHSRGLPIFLSRDWHQASHRNNHLALKNNSFGKSILFKAIYGLLMP